MADLSTATVDEIAEELSRRDGLSFLLMTRLETPDVSDDEREAIYLAATLAERPLIATHWVMEQVTAMVVGSGVDGDAARGGVALRAPRTAFGQRWRAAGGAPPHGAPLELEQVTAIVGRRE